MKVRIARMFICVVSHENLLVINDNLVYLFGVGVSLRQDGYL